MAESRQSKEKGHAQDPPIAVSVTRGAKMLGVSRAALYPKLMDGTIPSFRIGRRRVVAVETLREWATLQSQGDVAAIAPAVRNRDVHVD